MRDNRSRSGKTAWWKWLAIFALWAVYHSMGLIAWLGNVALDVRLWSLGCIIRLRGA
jgi:hypothetical protein